VYGVRVVISEAEWGNAVSSAAHLFRTVDNVEKPARQNLLSLYQSFIERLLQNHYAWLRENGITTVVRPCESNERCFVFYFQSWRDAERFRNHFQDAP
jgi:hypothetical protein